MGYVESLLGENEEIVVKTRQHWRVMASSLIVNGLLFIILVSLGIGFQVLPALAQFRSGILTLVLLVVAIFPILAFLREYLEWWNEEYIVTNRRVIQAQGVLSKHVIDSSLNQINDVVLTQSLLGRLFNYGDLEILTASEIGVNMFRMIAEPLKFKMAMMNQREAMSGGREAPRDRTSPDEADLLKELDQLHQQGVLTDQEYREKKAQLLARM